MEWGLAGMWDLALAPPEGAEPIVRQRRRSRLPDVSSLKDAMSAAEAASSFLELRQSPGYDIRAYFAANRGQGPASFGELAASLGTRVAQRTAMAQRAFVAVRDEPPEVDEEDTDGTLGDRINVAATDSLMSFLTRTLHMSLEDNVRHSVNHTCSRLVTRDVTKMLTASLTSTLVAALLQKLPEPYLDTATRVLNKVLTPTLTQSVSLAVAHSISRFPQDDYFCYFCKTKQVRN